MDIFDYQIQKDIRKHMPLAERMRPQTFEDFIGQEHVVGEGKLLRQAIVKDRLFSMIFWGPPGCGKTTLARIIANMTKAHFAQISAVLSGVKDIRGAVDEAKNHLKIHGRRTILFVDEIHRFNKSQQDAFLHHVESGLITLIGATTENPSFEVIAPLLSRLRVFTLKSLLDEDIERILSGCLKDEARGLKDRRIMLSDEAKGFLVGISQGDARNALNNLEIAVSFMEARTQKAKAEDVVLIELKDIEAAFNKKALRYDKSADAHYDHISAFHKSLRGSDPDAALYWMARMLEAGEDPVYVARRMIRFASEDIGNADPLALRVALNALDAFRVIGMPEGELALAQAAIYLSTAPKSNSVYTAYHRAKKAVHEKGSLPVPLHIRNAPTKLMKDLNYGKGYQYAHDHKDAFVPQEYLPDALLGTYFYHPVSRGYEKIISERLFKWRALIKKKRMGKDKG